MIFDWLNDWLIGWKKNNWLIDLKRMIDWLFDLLIDWLIDCLIDWLIDWIPDSRSILLLEGANAHHNDMMRSI